MFTDEIGREVIKKDARVFGVADAGVEVGRISFEMP